MSTTTTTTPREIWHAIRRARTTRLPDGRVTRPSDVMTQLQAREIARQALRDHLGTRRLPAALGELADRTSDALHRLQLQPQAKPIADRLRQYRRRLYLNEASRRGLPTVLDLARAPFKPLLVRSETLTPEGWHVALLHAEGWADYGSRHGYRRAALAILAGRDDAGLWAVRVPSTMPDADTALEWLEPALVRNARLEGKRVLRQGDVYVVERIRDGMATAVLPAGHSWDPAARVLRHGAHAQLPVPFAATVARQSTLDAVGSKRRRGD